MTTPAPPETGSDWMAVLARLITAGAELAVTDPDGTLAYRAPLARHHRVDDDHPVLWIRPLPEPAPPRVTGGPSQFGLNTCRRRSLPTDQVTVGADRVTFGLPTGQTAQILPIGDDLRPQLDRWDDFVLTVLPGDIELALEDLTDDSWHGPWA